MHYTLTELLTALVIKLNSKVIVSRNVLLLYTLPGLFGSFVLMPSLYTKETDVHALDKQG